MHVFYLILLSYVFVQPNCWNSYQKYAWPPEWPDSICCIFFELQKIISQHWLEGAEILKNLFQLIVITVDHTEQHSADFWLQLLSQYRKPRQLMQPHNTMLLPTTLFLLLMRCSLDTFQLHQCFLPCQLPLGDLRLQPLIVQWSVTCTPDAFPSTTNHPLCTTAKSYLQ